MLEKGGLVKLTEECGELIQVASKKQTCMDSDIHYDGLPIASRMEEEIGDVLAAISMVVMNFQLDINRIEIRRTQKFALFQIWDKEKDN